MDGPLADAGLGPQTADLWVADGVYDPSGVNRAEGRDARIAIYHGKNHQALIQRGSMHMTALAQITIDGDSATAIGYSLLALHDGDGFKLLCA
jgi:hypothetical protein